jgi:kynurenine formamidase
MSTTLAQLMEDLVAKRVRIVDLTQPLAPETPVIELPPMFAPSPPLSVEVISHYDAAGPAWYWNTLTLGEHTGTHFDAPVHWVTGKDLPDNTTDTLDPATLVGPACVIDVTAEVEQNADFLLTPEHITAWEQKYGLIPPGAWVLLHTGWASRGADKAAYFNADENGPHTPGPSKAAIEFLVREREIAGWGVETVGTDAGQAGGFDPPFPAHTLLHGAGKYGLASLTNLDQLPPTGALLIAAPLKIVNGSGSPVRVLALVTA